MQRESKFFVFNLLLSSEFSRRFLLSSVSSEGEFVMRNFQIDYLVSESEAVFAVMTSNFMHWLIERL